MFLMPAPAARVLIRRTGSPGGCATLVVSTKSYRWYSSRPSSASPAPSRPTTAAAKMSITPPRQFHGGRAGWTRMYSSDRKYEAIVVGAGPAGLAVVGNLLEVNKGPVLWVDYGFDGGRLNRKYREVPSNTKVKFFTKYAQGVDVFRRIADETPAPHAVSHLLGLDQEATCHIAQAADMCLMLTAGLDEAKGVTKHKGRVTDASWANSTWTVTISPPSSDRTAQPTQVDATRLILCTGASPIRRSLPGASTNDYDLIHLPLDVALSRTLVSRALLNPDYNDCLYNPKVAVIGASHSAILVLRNLANLADSIKTPGWQLLRIKWFTRHPLRYAEEQPGGWIRRDNTGLKGEAAAWARAHLEPAALASSPHARHLVKVETPPSPTSFEELEAEAETYRRELADCTHVCQAVGYKAGPLPELRVDDVVVAPRFDHDTGAFTDKNNADAPIPGLYGAGIAFPQRVVDPEGNTEYAVGLFKFMNFLRKVVPEWTSSK